MYIVRNISVLAMTGAMLAGLAGCTNYWEGRYKVPMSTAPEAVASGPSKEIISALECIQESKVLSNIRFAVAVHADGTGKVASGYEGSTGSFLPQGTSAIWAAQAVMYAGGRAINYYELNTETALRKFGGEDLNQELSVRQAETLPDFVISTAFTALDFTGGPAADIRVAGIGPFGEMRGASIEVSAEIYRPGDRMTLAISSLSRQVQYTEVGLGISKFFGSDNDTLVTGAMSWTDQQRLQEATRDAVALSVADVLSTVPKVPAKCRSQVLALSSPTGDNV